MDDQERRQFEMIVRASDFADANKADFAGKPIFALSVTEIKAVINELEQTNANKVSSDSTRRQGSTQKAAARQELRDDLTAISRTARAMAIDVAGLDDKFRMARTNNDQTLIATARAFAADAVALESKFIEYDLPADFIKDLNDDIAAFDASFQTPNDALNARVASNAKIDDDIERGLKAVRRLDAIVRNRYRNDSAKLAAWTSARHVERNSRKSPPPVNPVVGK